MDLLFEIDAGDYAGLSDVFERPSSRGIISVDGKLALVYSTTRGYYKFPGGGIEKGESPVDALVREVREESGLQVIRESVREYGLVRKKQRGNGDFIFLQENYYFTCDVLGSAVPQELDIHETEAGFTTRFVGIDEAIAANEAFISEHPDVLMIRRELGILRMLKDVAPNT